jgi:hypothetical protein
MMKTRRLPHLNSSQAVQLPLLVLASLLAIAALLEGLARLPFIEKLLPPLAVGSPHPMFEFKLSQMDRLAGDGVDYDCIIVGSSIAFRGIDPRLLSKSTQVEPGTDPLHCYNFGLSQVTASEVGTIVPILVERYDIEWVIYATSIRDFNDKAGDPARLALIETPWIKTALGQPSLAGWLSHHSRSYQLYLAFCRWFRKDLWNAYQEVAGPPSVDGYLAFPAAVDAGLPDPGDFPVWLSIQFEDYQISKTDLDGLDRLHVVVVEMPLPATYYTLFTPDDYRDFQAAVGDHTREGGGAFITPPANLIPDDGWADYHHLNEKGSEIFSAWLGRELAGDN